MNTPQAVKAIRERRERREAWSRLMEAVNEDWRPTDRRAASYPGLPVALQAPQSLVVMEKWWKVDA